MGRQAGRVSATAALLGRRVRARRESVGLTVGQLAAYASDPAPDGMKITKSWLSRLERGQIAGPSYQRLQRVAHALSCSVQDLGGSPTVGARVVIEVPQDEVLPLRQRIANLPGAAIEQVNKVVEALGLYTHEVNVEMVRDVPPPQRPADDTPDQRRDGHNPHHAPPEGTYHG